MKTTDKSLIMLFGNEIFIGHGKLEIRELVSVTPHLTRGQSTGTDAGI